MHRQTPLAHEHAHGRKPVASAARRRVGAILDLMAAQNMRRTPQRMMVLEALARQPGHRLADELARDVQQRFPRANKSTVYRTLEVLAALELISVIHNGGQPDTFELRDIPHHHLRCKECGLELQIPDAILDSVRRSAQSVHCFWPKFDHMILVGLCPVCQADKLGDNNAAERPFQTTG